MRVQALARTACIAVTSWGSTRPAHPRANQYAAVVTSASAEPPGSWGADRADQGRIGQAVDFEQAQGQGEVVDLVVIAAHGETGMETLAVAPAAALRGIALRRCR